MPSSGDPMDRARKKDGVSRTHRLCTHGADMVEDNDFFSLSAEKSGQYKSAFLVFAERGSLGEAGHSLEWFREELKRKKRIDEFAHFPEDWLAIRLLGGSSEEAAKHTRLAAEHFGDFRAPMQKDLVPICNFLAGMP